MEVPVYFIDSRVETFYKWWQPKESLANKVVDLFEAAGFGEFVHNKKIAVKVHMGEAGNTKYLRPIFIRKIVEKIKAVGGEPFVVDTCGLGLMPSRTSAKKYLDAAAANGFTPETVGAPIVIADGENGFDHRVIKAPLGFQLEEIFIPETLFEADAFLIVSRTKGHIEAGFGGALKNIGVGCTSKTGKFFIHNYEKPVVDKDHCTGCGKCFDICPTKAIEIAQKKARVFYEKCFACNGCFEYCESKAILIEPTDYKDLSQRFVETAKVIIDTFGKEKFRFINFILDVTPHCDCHPYSDMPIVPDIGVLASIDPVAIDQASIDLINNSPGLPNSAAEDHSVLEPGADKFNKINPKTNWKIQIETGVKLGLGSKEYNLIDIFTHMSDKNF